MKFTVRIFCIVIVHIMCWIDALGQTPTFQYAVDFGNCDIGFFVVPSVDSGFVSTGRNDNTSFITKHDKDGAVKWSRHIDQDPNQWYHSIEPTNDGGYILLGLTDHLQKNYFQLVKLDTGGNIVWEEHYDVTDTGCNPNPRSYLGLNGVGLQGMKCRQTADSGYVVAAEISLNGNLNYYLIFRTDLNGNVLWSYTYDVGGVIMSDMELSDKSTSIDWIVLSGTVYGDTNKINLTCVDDFGNLLWSKNYSLSSASGGYSIDLTSDNGIAVTGHVYDSISFNVNGSMGQDVFLMKTDFTGNPVFAYRYSIAGANIEFGNSVVQTNDTGYLIGGTHAGGGALGFDSVNAFLLKTTVNGAVLWSMDYGTNSAREELLTVMQGYDLNYVGIGYVDADVYVVKANSAGITGCDEEQLTINQTVLTPVVETTGARNSVTVSPINIAYYSPQFIYNERYMCADLTGISDLSHSDLVIFPNPAGSYLFLESPDAALIETVSIFSSSGQMVRSIEGINSARVSIDLGELSSGVYFLQVLTTDGMQTRRFIRD